MKRYTRQKNRFALNFATRCKVAIAIITSNLQGWKYFGKFRNQIMDENIHTIQEGWPNHKLSVDQSIREYWPICDIINSQNGLLLCRERLIVPSSIRNEMLWKIHKHHLGIEKCKRKARDLLYWLGMNSQIHDLVSKCNTCLLFKNKQQREPMKGYKIPD